MQDVKELFDYIVRYVPQKIELDYKLKPFIPDFIPAVGDIDAFIKVESNNPLELGLTVLDEPSAKQSDPNIMELQLRYLVERKVKVSFRLLTSLMCIHHQVPDQDVQRPCKQVQDSVQCGQRDQGEYWTYFTNDDDDYVRLLTSGSRTLRTCTGPSPPPPSSTPRPCRRLTS